MNRRTHLLAFILTVAACSGKELPAPQAAAEIPVGKGFADGRFQGTVLPHPTLEGVKILQPPAEKGHNTPALQLPVAIGELKFKHPDGFALGMTVNGADPAARLREESGAVVYRDALPSADLTYVSNDAGIEEMWTLKDARAPSAIYYRIRLDGGAARVRVAPNGVLELLDAKGWARMRAAKAFVVGADGEKRPATYEIRRDELAIRWDTRGLKYPAVLDPQWTLAKDMSESRYGPYCAILNDGTILTAGGYGGGSGYLGSAEVYNAATNTWTVVGSMSAPRINWDMQNGGMPVLKNGKALVAAGYSNSGMMQSAEIYDPGTQTWSSAGNVSVARYLHATVWLGDNKVLVAGGYSNNGTLLSLAEVFDYDTSTTAWTTVASMATARYIPAFSPLSTGKAIMVGGYNWNGSGYLNSAEVYDVASNTWTASTFSNGRYLAEVSKLNNGKVLLAGGYGQGITTDAQLFDPVSNTWSAAGTTQDHGGYGGMATLGYGPVLLSGGGSGPGLADLYDPASNTWKTVTKPVWPGYFQGQVPLGGANAIWVGGYNTTGTYEARSQIFSPIAALTVISGDGQTAVVGATLAPFVMSVQDPFGNTVPGGEITTTPSGDAKVTPKVAVVSTSGTATTTATLGTVAGPYTYSVVAGATAYTFNATANAGPAVRFDLTGLPTITQAGTGLPFDVTAYDKFNNVATGYTGTVTFTSTDFQAGLPASATLTSGKGTFSATYKTAGTQAITASDTGTSSATCGTANEGGTVTISCPGGTTIKSIDFASYGTPTGSCGSFGTSSCHASSSASTVSSACLGLSACSVGANNSVFGDPCIFTGKRLYIQVSCGTKTVTGTSAVTQVKAGPPAIIAISSGNGQSAKSGTTLPGPLQVLVSDAFNNPTAGVTVNYGVGPAGGSVSASSATTNSVGVAQVNATLGPTVGSYTFTASSGTLTNSPLTFTADALASDPASIALVSGDGQTGQVTTKLAQPFAVLVKDTNGNPVKGISVGFAAVTSGASVVPQVATTDVNGIARSFGVLSQIAGPNAYQAVFPGVAGSPVNFNATGTAAPVKKLTLTGLLNAAAGTKQTLSVVGRDQFDNVDTTYTGLIHLTSDDGQAILGADANLVGGQGSFFVTLGTAGTRTVTATDTVVPSLKASTTVVITNAAASALVIDSGNNQTGAVGSTLPVPLKVRATDAYGNSVQGVTVGFAPAATGTVSPASAVTATDGTAGVSATLGTTPGNYTFVATSAGLTGSPISFSARANPAAPARLLIGALPANSTAGVAGSFTVTAQDQYGNTVTAFSDQVRFSSDDASATVPGISLLTAGTGSFSATFRTAGVRTLTVTDVNISSLNGTAATTVGAAAAKNIALLSGNGQTTTAGTATPQPAVVSITDTFGNVVQGTTVTFAAVSAGASITPTSMNSDSAGKASATPTVGSVAATYDYTASSAGLTGSPVRIQATARAGTPTTLVYVSGGGQTGTVGKAAASPLVVQATDAFGNGVSGAVVNFAVASGGGNVNPATSSTNSSGQAQATAVLGNGSGTQTYTATAAFFSGTITFDITASPEPATKLVLLSGNNQSGTAGSLLGAPFVTQAQDRFNNPVPGVSVTWSSSTSGASVNPQVSNTDSAGKAQSFGKLATAAGGDDFQAVFTSGGTPVGFTATGNPAAAKSFSLTGLVPAAAGTTQTVTVTALDQFGNAATAFNGVVHLSSDDASATLGADAALVNGARTFSVRLVSAGQRTVSALDTATSAVSGAAQVQVNPAAAASVAIAAGNGQTANAGGNLPTALRVVVKDAFGNPVAGVPVSFTAVAGGASVSPSATSTATDGTAATIATLGPTAGAQSFSAGSGTLAGSPLSFSATATPGAPTRLAFSGLAASVTAGQSPSFTITAKDAFGNTVTGYTGPVSFGSSDAKATLPANASLTGGTGTFSATLKTAGAQVITATDLISSSLSGNGTTTVAAATPATLTLVSGDGQTTTVSTTAAQPIVVKATDAFGNPSAAVTVTFASVTAGGSVSPGTVNTGSSGQASATPTVGATVNTYDYTASAPGLSGSPIRFSIAARAGTASALVSVSGNGQTGTVGQTLASPLVVKATDSDGNAVAGATVSFTVTSGSGSISPASAITDSTGQARANATLGTTAGAQGFRASAGFTATPVNFTATAGAASASGLVVISGNNQTGTVGASLAAPFVVQVNDSNANPVAGVSVTFSSSTASASVNPQVATTDASGRAQGFGKLSTAAGANTFQASIGSGSPVTFAASGNPGAVNHLRMTGVGSAPAGTAQTAAITALDSFDNVVPAYAGVITLSSSDPSAVLGADSALGGGSGTFAVKLVTAGPRTVTAAEKGRPSLSVTASVSVDTAAAATVAIVSGDSQAATVGTALPQPLVVVVKDAFGNAVSGVTVAFAPGTGGGTITPATALTDASGIASADATLSGTAGTQTFTASSSGLTGSPRTFSAVARAGTTARLEIAGLPASSSAGISASFSVTARDQFGNVVAGYPGTVKFSSSDVAAVLPANGPLANGTGSFSAVFKTSGTQTVTAADTQFPAMSGSASTSVSAGAGATLALVSGDRQITQVGTATAQPVVVLATDSFGNPVQGVTVAFAAGAAGGRVSAASATTDAKGLAQTRPSPGNNVGVYDYSAASTGLSGSPVTFQVVAKEGPATKLVYVSGGGQAGIVKQPLSAPLMVSTTDDFGNRVAKATVTFAAPGDAAVASTTVVSDGSGLARTSATLGSVAGPQLFTARAAFTTEVVTFTQTATPAAASTIALVSGDGQTGVAGSVLPGPLKVVISDAFGNTVPGIAVTFAALTATAQVNPSTVNTDPNGLAAAVATLSTAAGANDYTAAVSGLTGSPVKFAATGVPGSGAKLLMTGAPASAAAGEVITVTITAMDASGNVATGFSAPVHFSSSDLTAVLPANATLLNGKASFPITFKRAGAQTVTVSDTSNGAQSATSAVNVSSGIATTLALVSGDKQSGRPGVLLSEPLKVKVTDALGNPVSGVVVLYTPAGGGSVAPTTVTTDGQGLAQAFATVGPSAGTFTYSAASAGLSGSPAKFDLTVSAGAAKRLALSGLPTTMVAGVSGNLVVKALDASNNVDTSYSGTVTFTSSDPTAVLPPDTQLASGQATFAVTFKTAGLQAVSSADSLDATLSGTQGGITVKSAVAARVAFTPKAASVPAGANARLSLQVEDDYGNPVALASTLSFSVDRGAKFVATTLGGATGLGTATLTGTTSALGTGSIDVTDVSSEKVVVAVSGTGLSRNTADVSFASGSPDHFSLVPVGAPKALDCGCIKVDVQLLDKFNNPVSLTLASVHLEVTQDAQITASTLGDVTATFPLAKLDGTLLATGGAQVTVCDSKPQDIELRVSQAQINGQLTRLPLSYALGPVSATATLFTNDSAKLQSRLGKAKLTVTPRSECGNNLPAGAKVELVKTGEGTLSPIKDLGDGTYTAELTASTCPTDHVKIAARVNGIDLATPLDVEVVCAPFSVAKTEVTLSRLSATVCNDVSKNQITATITPRDDLGGKIGPGTPVSITVDGMAGGDNVKDVGDGTYTADFTAATCSDAPRPVSVKVRGVEVAKPEAVVTFPCAKIDASKSGVMSDKPTLLKGDTAKITLAAINSCGEPAKGKEVTLAVAVGVLEATTGTTDEAGVFTTNLSSQTVSDDVLNAKVDGVDLAPLAMHYDSPPSLATSGCGCSADPSSAVSGAWVLVLALGMARRRRQ